ncbi:MAG: ABC transporter substrate-binding protein [Eubacteriales bacterium]|nr:ABC transporter substrate-binding protein [Eubacteriales bacterium]
MKCRKQMTFLVALTLILSLAACEGKQERKKSESGERETVTVCCWSEHMIYSGYAAYVQSQVPDADVVFVAGHNSMDYYEFMKENGALPDILTVRRMSMIDAENLREDLLDLSETETAAAFHNIYLENYRFDDGTINWLPACGEVDGYIANLDLFEQYNVPVPTDRASFDAACEAFRSAGVMPYSNDFGKDYTCLETLQGLSIQELMSGEGIQWRTAYESGEERQLDDLVWPAAFERLERQLRVWDIPKEAAQNTFEDMVKPFREGKAAIMRGTGNDVIAFKEEGMNVGMLPYFGDTQEDNWLLTYPSFNAAVNRAVAQDSEKERICLEVFDVMFSEGAQNILAGSHNMIPYNTGVKLELDESMKNLEPYIQKNYLYLRLASTEIFSASLDTVGKMVAGEYTAKEAYEAFNQLLMKGKKEEEKPVVRFEKGYPNVFDPAGGNPAASAVTNTLRNYFGSDIVIAQGVSYAGIVYPTTYTQRQLDYMITDTTIRNYTKELTGAQLRQMIECLLTKEYGGISVINRYFLPILSGCEMTVTRSGEEYCLEKLTRNGKEISDADVFTVTYIGSLYQAVPMLEELWKKEGGLEAWMLTEENVQQHWRNCILGGEGSAPCKLEEPTAYITMREEEDSK